MTTAATRMSNNRQNDLVHLMHCQAFEIGRKVVDESTSKTIDINLKNAIIKINKAFQFASKQDGFYLEAVMLFAVGYAAALYDLNVEFSVYLDTVEKTDLEVNGNRYQLKLGKFDQDQRYLRLLAQHNVELMVVRTSNQAKHIGGYSLVEAFTKIMLDANLYEEDVQDMQSLLDALKNIQKYL